MIAAVIFDMDGVLLDSEPFWRRAEIQCFADVGIQLTEEQCLQTQGIRMAEITEMYYSRSPWDGISPAALTQKVIDEVAEQISLHGRRLAGVEGALSFFEGKKLPLGLATSSPEKHIEAVLRALDLNGVFKVTYSADREPYGKPHPGVYLTTAKALGVAPQNCLAIEDSVNGVLAAKAARMKCLAVPEEKVRQDPRFAIADLKLNSLSELSDAHWAKLAS
ncbi:MAG: hexitol phosphatase HxpB [Bdellovibrionales bacterium]|nr:hexitol phosphatase HxpB [Bdellovibrionales bacterium]